MTARTNRRGASYFQMGSNNVICDRTGFKVKATECAFEWNGLFVRRESWEERQPQDLIRGIEDQQAPEVVRPGTGDEFLAVGAVSRDDL